MNINLEEGVLRRTVHIGPLTPTFNESRIRETFSRYGEIAAVRMDSSIVDGSVFALIQFVDDNAVIELLRLSQVKVEGHSIRITVSRITIDPIPPTDAVFGKPMTIGNHVMAINPSRVTGYNSHRRERAMKAVKQAASRLLVGISRRSGWVIPDGEIERLVADDGMGKETPSFVRRSKTRSRSRTRGSKYAKNKTLDEEEWERERTRH
jgi:hypothetical protein